MDRQAKGFTLVEMLVVISIITVLAALILPAVQNARESARRLQCQNRMKQVGLALIQFSTAKAKFPARGRWLDASVAKYMSSTANTDWGSPAHSWVVDVLPFLEQQEIHTRWSFTEAWNSATNLALGGTFLKVLVCPDDDTVEAGEGNLSFAINGGFFPDYQQTTSPDDIDYNQSSAGTGTSDCRDAGLAWPNWERSVSSITDGTTTTVLLAESLWVGYHDSDGDGTADSNWAYPLRGQFRSKQPSDAAASGSDATAYDAANNININPSAGISEAGYDPVDDVTPTRSVNAHPPSSYHPGGVNVCFCDGHIQFISDHVDGRVWAKLITPRGGRVSSTRLKQLPPDEDDF